MTDTRKPSTRRWHALALGALVGGLALSPAAQAQTATHAKAPAKAASKSRPKAKAAAAAKVAPKATSKARPKARATPVRQQPAASAPAQSGARAATPAARGPVLADRIIAVVNSEPITDNELRARIARAREQSGERGAALPPPEQLRAMVLERLISERAQLQLAREQGIRVDPVTLRQAEQAVARQNQLDSVEALHQRLAAEGIALKDFQDDLRNQITLQRLREREIEPKVQVSDAEVDRFLREQARAAGVSAVPELNLAMILIAVPEGASSSELARLQQKAEDVARRARAGEGFAALAREASDANNRGADGGELGLRSADRYPTLFVQSTQNSAVGSVVGPVRSAAGFHLLKVLERRQSGLPPMTVAQTHVRHILLRLDAKQDERLARERMTDIRRRVAGGASFADLARQYSQDASAPEGGDLGWATPGQFVPEFEQAMNALQPGQMSEPVRSRFGLHLIQVEDRRQQTLSPDQQRQLARNVLRERKATEAFERWAEDVRGRAYVELREGAR